MKKLFSLLMSGTLLAAGCNIQSNTATRARPTPTPSTSAQASNTPTPNAPISPVPSQSLTVSQQTSSPYPWHTNITTTVFWVGEPVGNGSSEDNALSAYDDDWRSSFGCFDDPLKRSGYYPAGCTPKENPFYLDLPYADFDDSGVRKADASTVVPWAHSRNWSETESMMKNQWVELYNPATKQTCYGQIQDAGPYEYDDVRYVFGAKDDRPKNTNANYAGMDVSPALRDCLKFTGTNNDENSVHWRFASANSVPAGPWKSIVTTSGIHWK
ncbi:MAG: hypothetical protein KBD66_00375 [Candidatus Doudnabacteria bacterium]|nr:hypothetical protein [Candidatus Doudnabacteria bacterium]